MDKYISIVGVLSICVVGSDGGFAPSGLEEANLTNCLRHRRNSEHCFGKDRKRLTNQCGGLLSGSVEDLTSADEYICALGYFFNTHRTVNDVNRAVVNSGSCSRDFRSVAETWKQFLAQRGDEVRSHRPSWQYTSQSNILVRFVNDNFSNGWDQAAESLKAVDIVISKTKDDEIYGKYSLKISIARGADGWAVIHDTMQATCPTVGRRFFVAGLNDDGVTASRKWLLRSGNIMDFFIKMTTEKRLTENNLLRGLSNSLRNYDVGPKVSAIVFHFNKSSAEGAPMPDGMIFHPRAGRIRRSRTNTACHRAPYIVDYRDSNEVIRPTRLDVGACVGSCDDATRSSANMQLNATNHALSLLWDKEKVPIAGNPNPTVCCIPTSYRRFHYTTRDSRSNLMDTFKDGLVAGFCGCH